MSSVNQVPALVHRQVRGIPADRCQPGARILKVTVLRGSSLLKKDIFGTSDPYCRVSLVRESRQTQLIGSPVRTQTIKCTLNPLWNEEFYFRVNPERSQLLFELFDENRITRDDFLGLVVIYLPQLDIRTESGDGRLAAKNFLLRPRSLRSRVSGKLLLGLAYLPSSIDIHLSEIPIERLSAGHFLPSTCLSNGISLPSHAVTLADQETIILKEATDTACPVLPAEGGAATPPGNGLRMLTGEIPRQSDNTPVINEPTEPVGDDPMMGSSSVLLENEPLPEGWDERIDQNGRTYYVDHINRRTQWDRPLSYLPDGWEQRTDINGRVYYVDHINHRTTWYSPLSLENETWLVSTQSGLGEPDAPPMDEFAAAASVVPLYNGVSASGGGSGVEAEILESTGNASASARRVLRTGTIGGPSSSTRTNFTHMLGTLSTRGGLLVTGPTPEEEVQAAQTMYLRRHQVSAEDTTPRCLINGRASQGNVFVDDDEFIVNPDAIASVTIDGSRSSQAATSSDHLVGDNLNSIPTSTSGLPVDQLVAMPPVTGTSILAQGPPPLSSVGSGMLGSNSEPSSASVAPINAILVGSSASSSDNGEALPRGWQVAFIPGGRPFFINHNDQTTTWDDPRKHNRSQSSSDRGAPSILAKDAQNRSIPVLGPLPPGWEERIHTNGRIFYINHNARATQWEDPRLEHLGGPAVPYSRNYRQKYEYFRSRLRAPRDPLAKFEIRVTRHGIFEDSFRLIHSVKKPEVLMHRLWIEFLGEKGLDYGGVQREWFFLLSRQMFNPYYGLFEYSAADNYTLQINPLSGLANEDHLLYFKFVGRVCGMAVYHGKLVDGFFIRPFYKMMLGKKITLKDMEAVDSEYYRSLKYILKSDPRDLGLTFSVDEEHFGETVEVDLGDNGRNIPVTNENKRQYIEKIINWRFVSRVEHQMYAFLDGFNDLIPLETLQLFDSNELELLMCGLQDINVMDWKSNSVYKGEYNANHPVIVNFWRTLFTFTNELRSRLLQFVTGTSRVPMNGFVELWGSTGPQKFTIESWGTVDQLPRAHTCFNRLDLPPYPTFETMRYKLIIAIENAEGFEGVD